MSTSLSNNARAPYHLTLPDSGAQAGTFFFLLFVFMWPFQRVPFLTDNLFGIQGLKPFNLLSAVVLAYLVFDTAPLHATDKIERTSIRIFLLYFATLAIALIRSVPNAPLLHSRFPDSFPESYFDFVLSACIVPTFYTLSFLFTLRAYVLLSGVREDHDGDLPFDTIAINRFRRSRPDKSVRSAFRSPERIRPPERNG